MCRNTSYLYIENTFCQPYYCCNPENPYHNRGTAKIIALTILSVDGIFGLAHSNGGLDMADKITCKHGLGGAYGGCSDCADAHRRGKTIFFIVVIAAVLIGTPIIMIIVG